MRAARAITTSASRRPARSTSSRSPRPLRTGDVTFSLVDFEADSDAYNAKLEEVLG